MTWQQLIIPISEDDSDFVSDFFEEQGAIAVTLLWEENKVQGLFSKETDLIAVINDLKKRLNKTVDYEITLLADTNWVESTQRNFPALNFAEKLWVVPVWEDPMGYSGKIVRINPGLGFGTGTHPTTALCLTELLHHEIVNKIIIDYGCGSGILGLAALAMGAKHVWFVDNDPEALVATKHNAELNHFIDSNLSIVFPSELPAIKTDMMLANILANPLCELAPQLIAYLEPHGSIILSGFFTRDREKMLNAYDRSLTLIGDSVSQDWECLHFQRQLFYK